jgi:hypothetical protein
LSEPARRFRARANGVNSSNIPKTEQQFVISLAMDQYHQRLGSERRDLRTYHDQRQVGTCAIAYVLALLLLDLDTSAVRSLLIGGMSPSLEISRQTEILLWMKSPRRE